MSGRKSTYSLFRSPMSTRVRASVIILHFLSHFKMHDSNLKLVRSTLSIRFYNYISNNKHAWSCYIIRGNEQFKCTKYECIFAFMYLRIHPMEVLDTFSCHILTHSHGPEITTSYHESHTE